MLFINFVVIGVWFFFVDLFNKIFCYVNIFIVDFFKGNEVMLDYLFVDNLF